MNWFAFLNPVRTFRDANRREMLLQRVVYELFEWEAEAVRGVARDGYDELFRQVRLEGADGIKVYISWAWGDGQPDYFLAKATDTFFTTPPETERDVSTDPAWRYLIGRPVTLAYQKRNRQVIEVRSEDAVVYCCSFQSDRVFVMQVLRIPRA
jgi:hypothetical protein